MPLNHKRTRELLQSFDFKTLFIEELGWDHYKTQLQPITIDSHDFLLTSIAEKRGMAVFQCCSSQKQIPDYATRRKIDKKTAKIVHEHLIIYTDAGKTTQKWQWVKREAGKPTACREHTYHKNQPGDALIQKLQRLAFDLEEEEGLTITDVTGRARKAFDVDKITKRFYDRFQKEHKEFHNFIKGIGEQADLDWYASVMLNRLMFIYFIQKKGFLNNNTNYLNERLQALKGKDRFYRQFLIPLFFEGFSKEEKDRTEKINRLLGKIPYLNGGIFLPHPLEQKYGDKIQVPDAAFERLFIFFEQYQWHLDERPTRADNEINPDVLGYIFEKYINQKQMGAYYTKEDITEYISKNTVIPFLFDEAKKKCKIAFEGEQSVWSLLKEDPDRYIYDAVKKGVDIPLPGEIAEGLKNVSKRTQWNKPASGEYALPTEIWREVVARRKRYEEIKDKLDSGEIRSINDFITYNLDIRQFAQDIIEWPGPQPNGATAPKSRTKLCPKSTVLQVYSIENCEGPELLRAFWHAIEKVTVLDPTCGSGAFLFAALNILEPLYEACLTRMQAFIDDMEQSGKKQRPEKFSDFRKILERVEQHPNHRYFVLKSIIINNLYGVDIMEEAVEICKLRMFLKLMAQIERVEDIEPLPDIDFNIRAGNTLVGYASYEEVEKAVTGGEQMKLKFSNEMERIDEKTQMADRAFQLFHEMQTEQGMTAKDFTESKQNLRDRLNELEDELNRYLAKEYGKNPDKKTDYEKWLKSHQPFHWFIEFYGIIKKGGFDVIIGNPPYVEYRKVQKEYTLPKGVYQTETCGNVYAFMMERSYTLANKLGRFGMIVPISLVCTQRMETLQDMLLSKSNYTWHSIYAERPSKLFSGAEVLLSISISKLGKKENKSNFITGFRKWAQEEREALFSLTNYNLMKIKARNHIFPKVSDELEQELMRKTLFKKEYIGSSFMRTSQYKIFYRIGGGRYWKIFTTFQPKFKLNNQDSISSRENYLYFANTDHRDIALAVFSSTLFYWYFLLTTNGRDLNPSDLSGFPLAFDLISRESRNELCKLAKDLMSNYKNNKLVKEKNSKLTGHIEYEEFYPKKAKPIINEIDSVLAKHYGFTDKESDFIINYDIKYRMGKDKGSGGSNQRAGDRKQWEPKQ